MFTLRGRTPPQNPRTQGQPLLSPFPTAAKAPRFFVEGLLPGPLWVVKWWLFLPSFGEDRRPAVPPWRRGLIGRRGPQHQGVVQPASHDLQADGQAVLSEAGRVLSHVLAGRPDPSLA
jgi:hypothetical protein